MHTFANMSDVKEMACSFWTQLLPHPLGNLKRGTQHIDYKNILL